MNKDVIGIIERCILRYNIEQLNKQYRKMCSYSEIWGRLKFKEMSYNFRYFVHEYGKWNPIYIFGINYQRVAIISKNY